MFGFLEKLKKTSAASNKPPEMVDLSVYFMDEPYRYVRFKHACMGDYSWGNERPTLSGCSCGDFKKTGLPCWHMYKFALDSGVYNELFQGHEELIKRIESLSPAAFSQFANELYIGGIDTPRKISGLGRYANVIAKAGLISINGDKFTFSEEVASNQYFVIHYVMSDTRFKRK